AAAGLDGDAQREVVAAFLVEQGLDLGRGGVGQDDAVGDGGGLVRYGHLHLSRVVRRLLADECNRRFRGFIPGRAVTLSHWWFPLHARTRPGTPTAARRGTRAGFTSHRRYGHRQTDVNRL